MIPILWRTFYQPISIAFGIMTPMLVRNTIHWPQQIRFLKMTTNGRKHVNQWLRCFLKARWIFDKRKSFRKIQPEKNKERQTQSRELFIPHATYKYVWLWLWTSHVEWIWWIGFYLSFLIFLSLYEKILMVIKFRSWKTSNMWQTKLGQIWSSS